MSKKFEVEVSGLEEPVRLNVKESNYANFLSQVAKGNIHEAHRNFLLACIDNAQRDSVKALMEDDWDLAVTIINPLTDMMGERRTAAVKKP